MRGISKLLVGLGVAALAIAVATPALAQCPQAREFGAQGSGGTTHRIKIAPAPGFAWDGNELGSFWEAGTVASNNDGDHFGTDLLCPSNTWIVTGGMFLGTDGGITGFIASPGCSMTACPNNGAQLMTVVEDISGDGSDAGFVAYLVTETPATIRWYDHGNTGAGGGPVGANTTHQFTPWPTVDVQSSSGPPPSTTLTNNYADLALNYHGDPGRAAASNGIVSYDICTFNGPADPGRLRAAWSCAPADSIAYGNAAVVGDTVQINCPDSVNDFFVAVGGTYVGGVQSVTVGSSTRVECDPTIADPDDNKLARPRTLQRNKPLGRSGR